MPNLVFHALKIGTKEVAKAIINLSHNYERAVALAGLGNLVQDGNAALQYVVKR